MRKGLKQQKLQETKTETKTATVVLTMTINLGLRLTKEWGLRMTV